MSSKQVNIDTILEEGSLELTIGGVIYIITDVPLSVFLRISSNVEDADITPQELQEQLAAVLKVDVDKVKDIGIKAINFALDEIGKWMSLRDSSDSSDRSTDDTNP